LQYTHPLTRTDRLTLGAVYSPGKKLSATSYDVVSFDQYFSTITESDTLRNAGFDLPASFGAGLTYTKDYKLILAADVSYQNWKNAQFFGRDNELKDRLKIAVGAEYIPNNFTRQYMSRVRYRAGVHYNNSYLNTVNAGDEYGFCLGAGFPLLDNRSFVNASFEYVKVTGGLINEQYVRFTVSYTFNEYWFFKRRMD